MCIKKKTNNNITNIGFNFKEDSESDSDDSVENYLNFDLNEKMKR